MTALLPYLLPALLALAFVFLLTLPFVWLRGKIEEYADIGRKQKEKIEALTKDCRDFNSRLKLLDKPINDAALATVAMQVLKKTAQKNKGGKSFQRNRVATSKPRRRANGVGHVTR